MKRSLIIPLILIIFNIALPVGAQINLGIFGGLNISEAYTGNTEFEKSPLSTFTVGGLFEYTINENLSLRIDPIYQIKGFRSKTLEALGWDFKYKAEYLEIPVLIKYRFDRGRLEPYILAGPSLGYNLDCNYNASSSDYSSDQNIQEYTESYDLGVGIGGGIMLDFAHNSLFIECRYVYGVKNLNIASDQNLIPWEVNSRDFIWILGT